MSANPLHELIRLLRRLANASWTCSRANTKSEREQTLNAWNEEIKGFWNKFENPADAVRGLADLAIAYCNQKNIRDKDTTAIIEKAAQTVTALVKRTPTASPHVYANNDVADENFATQGKLLLTANTSEKALRKLAALTGDAWRPEPNVTNAPAEPKENWAEPLSILDLPSIRVAVETLYRTIETPPAGDWLAPAWITAMNFRGTEAEELAKRPPAHYWVIRAAVFLVVKALKLKTLCTDKWTDEIGNSPFDHRRKLALVTLCEWMADFLGRGWGKVDSGKSLKDRETLRTILADLDADPQGTPTSTPAEANAGEGADAAKNDKRKRRGAPVATDEKGDKRLCADWKAAKGQGMTRAAFAREKCISVNDIIAAQHRAKYRRQRDAE